MGAPRGGKWKRIPEDIYIHRDVGQDTHNIFSGLSEPSGTITLVSRLLARGYSTCVAVGKVNSLELPHSSHIYSIFHSRELSAVFTSSSRPLGDPALVIPFQPASRPFILFSPFTVSGTTLDWFCVQQCSRRLVPFMFTSFFSIPGVQLFVRRFVFSNHASLEQARAKCRYSRSDELGYQPSQLQ